MDPYKNRAREVFGYSLDVEQQVPIRESIKTADNADYGCDPLPDGTFRMVPSGDILTYEEMRKRLQK